MNHANKSPNPFATISFLLKKPFLLLLSCISLATPAIKLTPNETGMAADSSISTLLTKTYWTPRETRQLYEKCCILSIPVHLSLSLDDIFWTVFL